MDQEPNFLATLFDISFERFVTVRLVKVLFIIGLVCAVLAAVTFIIQGFEVNTGLGVIFLLLSPVVFLVYALLVRVGLEVVLVIFRIAEDIGRLAGPRSAAMGETAPAGGGAAPVPDAGGGEPGTPA
ncbi:MAG: DUF4282 domain-containing protein [Candidatus Krumholzibacteriota bacterium]|nr:DUF4282 domain-containing protein [Candidatus Krumholzibacteriota bacterium]